MTWLFAHIVDVGFWTEILIGIYTVYVGVQVKRRRQSESKVKITGSEIALGLCLLAFGSFFLGIHAIHAFGT